MWILPLLQSRMLRRVFWSLRRIEERRSEWKMRNKKGEGLCGS
jgi:hypothetical protein